MGQKKKKR